MSTPRLLWLALLAILAAGGARAEGPRRVLLAELEGAIGPASTEYLRAAIARAEQEGAEALVVRLDTPGGLAAATRDIDKAILAAKVPVVVWVAPSGAQAASAGTFILYASHVAAMAPGTNLGAATPVSIGGGSPPMPGRGRGGEEAKEREGREGGAAGDAMERKILEDSAAYIRALAELRGRNAEWGEQAVREGASLTAQEALERQVIDLVAGSLEELLAGLDGRTVRLEGGERRLATRDAEIGRFEPSWRHRFLSVITNPSVAYLLLLVGLYGLLLEGYNPGSLVPGVVGIICLLIAAYALQLLPVNYVGLALIVVGLALMVAEAITPSFGILGFGGLAALVFGSIVLFDREMPGFEVSRGLIAGVATVSGLLFLLLAGSLARSRRARIVTGVPELLAESAEALEDFTGRGRVRVRGEVWWAESGEPVRRGERLAVEAVEGLVLRVRPRRG
ncbi:MAG: nodulation protein NfeD [Xanthomonadales bacterium]|nr:nodulation protein NfeD [Xanthomonadales bacterium]